MCELRSKKPKVVKNIGEDFYTFLIEDDPLTYNEAMMFGEAPFLKEAIKSEMNSILAHETWVLIGVPLSSKPIGCK